VVTKGSKPSLATASIIYVEWVDAVSDGGWEDDIKVDIHPVRTIGYLVAETKDGICIASTLSGEMSNARMHIPKSWIVKRKEVKLEQKVSKLRKDKKTTPV
jgi:hypothetical protein